MDRSVANIPAEREEEAVYLKAEEGQASKPDSQAKTRLAKTLPV